MSGNIVKEDINIENKGIEDALKALEIKTKYMDILEEYNYLEGRFLKAMDFGEMEYGTKAYYMFRAIVKRLSEIELLIKEG